MRKLNILIITPYSNMSLPIRTQLAEIFGNYISAKHEIQIIIFSNREKIYKWKGCNIYEINRSNLFYKFKSIFIFFKYLNINSKKRIDVIFCRNFGGIAVLPYLFFIYFKFLKIPIALQLTTPIRDINNTPFIRKPIVYFKMKFLTKLSDLILPISKSMGVFLKYLMKIKDSKIYPLPDGVNLDKFFIIGNKIIENEKIVYIGSLDKERNLKFLINVMKRVHKEINNFELIIAGEGNDKESLIKLSESLNLTNNIEFLGVINYNKVPILLQNSFIGISPIPPKIYFRLSSPLKLFEYIAAGLIVVANREIIEQREVLSKTNSGILIPYDEEKFAESIIYILRNKEKFIKKKVNLKWIKDNRDYRILAQKLENELFKLISNKNKD